MPVLVDALNVLHVTGVLPPEMAGPEPADLAGWIERSRYRGEKVSLVCDGQKPSSSSFLRGSFVTLVWTGAQKADDRIAATLQESSHPRRHLVVSSDRQVQKTATRLGARTLSSATFLQHLASDLRRTPRPQSPDRNVTLDPRSVQNWLETFGLSGDSKSKDRP
ncbi:MAG: NYN domain-containing protein [Planctomycetes bacterium]|nr:NYN domain-containing protein [Planctomycetota bacterium]